MTKPERAISRYTTVHVSLAGRPDGSVAVSCVERTWSNGARDGGRVLDRRTITPDARPGSTDYALWAAGVYLQQLAARGVVTRLGVEPRNEAPREPLGAVGGEHGTPE